MSVSKERREAYGKFTILKYFHYDHLPKHLQEVSKPFNDLAYSIADRFIDGKAPDIAETISSLRKLLESKDCAVRASIMPKGN